MSGNELEDFIKSKKEILTKKERKINHISSMIKATEKRMKIFENVNLGGNFSCVCGCKKKMTKTSEKSKFKSISGSGNCKDKHYGNKKSLVKILSEITNEELKEIKTRVPIFSEMLSGLYEENKLDIKKIKQSKIKRRYP
jgi:hypothetical protein